ncbi:MAG: hypothetical protein JOZ54_24740 [Acidobacteria bacterium]|nr:hypothetical protein [Acidobacteriota bacterium]
MINIAQFVLQNVTDTCAVWNVLSSERMFRAAVEARCTFVMSGFVAYEAIDKPRTIARVGEQILRHRLHEAIRNGQFAQYGLDIEDLQSVGLLRERKRLGMGEVASIALAQKLNLAFLTDDQRARKLAANVGVRAVQTTPHLLGWLLHEGCLADEERASVIAEHVSLGGDIAKHLLAIVEEADRVRALVGRRVG